MSPIGLLSHRTAKASWFASGLIMAAVLTSIAGYACNNDEFLAPRHNLRTDEEPLVPDSGFLGGVYALPTPPDNNTAYASTNTGIPLPAGVVVRVTVQGMLTFSPNPDYSNCIQAGHFNPATLPGGATTIGPGGDSSYYAVTVGTSAGQNILRAVAVGADSTWGSIGVSGTGVYLWAGRPAVYQISCTYNNQAYPAYTPVTGTQTVRVTVMPPPVIGVNRGTVVSGDTVIATLSASWTTNIDMWYASWQWVADTGANGGSASFVSGSCGWSMLTCRAVVHGHGHFQVPNLRLDGTAVYQTAVSPTIHVAPTHLTLTVDSSHVASGSQVKFTAHRVDAKPVQVQSWVWTPGTTSPVGPVAVDCAGGDSLCKTTLQNTTAADTSGRSQTGTMMAVAFLGTAAESASTAVTVDRPVSGGGGISITVTTYTAPASFTANPPENSITLHASVVPSALANRTQWQVQPHPYNFPQPPLPGTLTGADASFSVTPLTPDRWPTDHKTALALAPKQLGYRITASVLDDAGHTYVSNSVDAVQDEMDTMREEYVELQVFRGVPGRPQLSPQAPSFPSTNSGDYNFMVFNNSFVGALNDLSFAWSGSWQVNSQYRNPVHQWFHVPQGDHFSWHQYGCAADLQTFPVWPSNAADSASAWGFWHGLAALARGKGFGVEDSLSSGIGHVHVQQPC